MRRRVSSPMETFAAEAPDVAAVFDRLIEALVSTDGLDARTKQIVYIAVKAAQGDATAVALHVPLAKRLGASRAEVRDAILLTLTTSGLSGVTKCLPAALQAYDSDSAARTSTSPP
jgi:alkylhydroperoxidase/carboxymuconolactone decarboxylase family protein YurZ